MCAQPCRDCLESGTHLSAITVTLIEAGIIVAWHVPIAAHHIVDVLAECRSISSVLTTTEAKFRSRHEILGDEEGCTVKNVKTRKSLYVLSTRVAARAVP
jgi:hypothetical protein